VDARGKETIVVGPFGGRSGGEFCAHMIERCLTEGRSHVFHRAMSLVARRLIRLAAVAHYSTFFSRVFGVEFTGELRDGQWGQPRADGAMEARYRHREGNQESQCQEAQGARKQRPKTPARRKVSYQGREDSSDPGCMGAAWASVPDRPLLRLVRLVSSPIVSLKFFFIISLFLFSPDAVIFQPATAMW